MGRARARETLPLVDTSPALEEMLASMSNMAVKVLMRGLPDEGFDEGFDGAGACLWPSEQTTAEVYIYMLRDIHQAVCDDETLKMRIITSPKANRVQHSDCPLHWKRPAPSSA